MERHNYYVGRVRLNPKRYEQYLSSFGNKVLAVLLEQWDKARIQNMNENQHRQLATQNKKVLTFNDNSLVDLLHMPPLIVPNIEEDRCQQIYLEENALHFNLTDKAVPEIPKSVELIKTVPKTINYKDDFLHPTIVANKNIVYNIYNKHSDDDTPFVEVTPNENTNKNKSEGIHWDDMLDSALFDNMTANKKEMNLDKIFDIRFRNENITFSKTAMSDNSLSNSNKTNISKGEKRKKITDSKAKKVRSDINAVENQQKLTESFKHVKQANKNYSFRKQNYTNAVKSWLNNIEPHHPVDGDLDNVVNRDNNEQNTTRDKGKTDVEIIDHKAHFTKIPILSHKDKTIVNNRLKIPKKVVQAQLANKDGVMKFSKPKHIVDKFQKYVNVQENKPNDKKVKKIVAPIKSQIPVKDVVYEIRTINEDNIENNRDPLREIKNNEIIAVLIYSNGFCQLNSYHTDDTCTPDGIIINNYDIFYCFKSTGQEHKETLKHLLENNKVVCYDGRSVLLYLASHLEMEINSINMYDAKIGASLLDPDHSPMNFMDFQRLLSFTAPYTIASECTLQKSGWYMSLLKECWAKLCGMLVEDSLWKVFEEIEMKLLPIVVDMERRGVCVDLVKLNSMEEVLLSRMKLVEQQCYEATGKVFQINSAVQVRAILYDELQLDTKCNVKIRETICKGAKSTSETMLRSLVSEHPLPKLILEYRHLHKAYATFLMGIAQHVKDGLVRPTWIQTAAATGRIASNNPNLQAIPKAPFSLVMFPDEGDDAADSEQLKFRSVYVSRAGHSLLAADFKHVECRVFAHVAADTALLHALSASDDLFKVLAAKWLKKPEAEIVAEERERTKRLVYASLYGAGTRKLMEILDVNYQQALQVAASFNRTFPSLKSFGRSVVSRCEQTGGRLATLCGRVRRFSNIVSEDFAMKTHAERQAVNFIVQGSAADLCKTAMILTEDQMRSSSPPVDAHLVLQIHDELVWEVNDQHVARATAIIKQVMEGCGRVCGMAVTLPVAISLGKDWGNMEPYTLHAQ